MKWGGAILKGIPLPPTLIFFGWRTGVGGGRGGGRCWPRRVPSHFSLILGERTQSDRKQLSSPQKAVLSPECPFTWVQWLCSLSLQSLMPDFPMLASSVLSEAAWVNPEKANALFYSRITPSSPEKVCISISSSRVTEFSFSKPAARCSLLGRTLPAFVRELVCLRGEPC